MNEEAERISLEEIQRARERIGGFLKRTPLDSSRSLSERAGASVYVKLENFQHTGSYKPRGAFNVIACLTAEQRRRGVVTFSAGNWAQAVAMASAHSGVPCVVVMPSAAVSVKVAATRGYGAQIVLYGANSIEMERRARDIAATRGMELLSPFDNREMMAGHGTLGLDIVEDLPSLGFIFAPVGGGSLIAGAGSAVKARRPDARVIGISAEGAASVSRSLEAGRVVEIPNVDTIADGLAVKRPGEVGLAIVRSVVDELILVSDDEIRRAMAWAFEREKAVLEPAGAAALAGLLSGKVSVDGDVAVVCSGGNVPLDRFCQLLG